MSPTRPALKAKFQTLLEGYLSNVDHTSSTPINADKWVAISCLHKSIRRGETKLALKAASCLLVTDPDYLFKRLPIIAYEDIGISNPFLCALTTVGSSSYLHKLYGRERVAVYLVQQLARSIKSRTATDLYCLTECDPYASQYLESCLSQSPSTWVGTAQDDSLSWTHRMTALRLITGYKWRGSDGHFQQVSSANANLILDACDAFNLPDSFRWAALCGHGKTEGLNGAFLLAHYIYSQSQAQQVNTTELKTADIDGIALSALDQFSRIGKVAMKSLITNTSAIYEHINKFHVRNPIDALGIAVFQVEGSLLDRRLCFDCSEQIKVEVEDTYLEQQGISATGAAELREIVRKELPKLNQIRTKLLSS